MNDISTLLFKAQTEYKKQKEQIDGAFAAELASLMVKAKAELSEALEKATDIYDNIPLEMRNDILTDKEIARKVSILTPRQGKKVSQGKGRVAEEDILNFLKTQKAQRDVASEFGLTNAGAGNRLKSLLKAKKVTCKDDPDRKGKKLWKAS